MSRHLAYYSGAVTLDCAAEKSTTIDVNFVDVAGFVVHVS